MKDRKPVLAWNENAWICCLVSVRTATRSAKRRTSVQHAGETGGGTEDARRCWMKKRKRKDLDTWQRDKVGDSICVRTAKR